MNWCVILSNDPLPRYFPSEMEAIAYAAKQDDNHQPSEVLKVVKKIKKGTGSVYTDRIVSDV